MPLPKRTVADLQQLVLLLSCALAFLVPLGVGYNISLKAVLVLILGAMSIVVLAQRPEWLRALGRWRLALLGIYLICVLFGLVHSPFVLNWFGLGLTRLGSLELFSIPLIALVLAHNDRVQLQRWLYITTVLVAAVSVPYSFYLYHGWFRPGGVFYQADILAAVVGAGFLLGLQWRRSLWRLASQAVLLACLLFTQTRAVIGLVILLSLVWLWLNRGKFLLKLGVTVALITLIGGFAISVHGSRLSDTSLANSSTTYRVHLQHAGLDHAIPRPLGYGPANIPVALSCRYLHSPDLKHTCSDGYYFDSSHNIYLDRAIAFGWLAGITFVAITCTALYRGFRTADINFALAGLLLALYYLTNVTNLELELLFWIILMSTYVGTQKLQSARR